VIEQLGNALFAIGVSYLVALLVGRYASRFHLPKVTGYLLVGLLAGPSLADILGYTGLIEWKTLESINILSEVALALIMVIIGSQFKLKTLRRWGKRLLLLSAAEVGITFFLVASAIFLVNLLVLKTVLMADLGVFGSSLNIALFTGIISVATAPAATLLARI